MDSSSTPRTPVPAVPGSPSSLPAASPGSLSHRAQPLTWAGALVAVSAVVTIALATPPAVAAYLSPDETLSRKGGRVLLGCVLGLIALAAPTSFRDVLTLAQKYLPGRK